MSAGTIDAELLDIEDDFHWDAGAVLDRVVRLEQRAQALGDELLIARAQLCRVNMEARVGDVASAARRLPFLHEWARRNDARVLLARIHLVWAGVHRHLGDAAQCLEHSVLSVELLDERATPHMRIWHRAKLADALGLTGSLDAARQRYAQTETLCSELHQPRLLHGLLNNWAYVEQAAGAHEQAREVAARLQALAELHGHELTPAALDTIGTIDIADGDFAGAERKLLTAIARHGEAHEEDADALAEYQLTLARAQRGLGAVDRAQRSLDASRALCEQRGLGDVLVRVLLEQSELHAARSEFASAYAVHREFFAEYTRRISQQREAQARTRQAMFEKHEAEQEALLFREQARRDPLTGLRNRRFADEELPRLIGLAGELTVAIVDLDFFKNVNDRLSHHAGDQVLVQVARLLEDGLAAIAPDGFAARLGGEEFLLVLPGWPVGAAAERLDGIRRAIRSHHWVTGGVPVTVSIGAADLAGLPEPGQAALLALADANLYAAKDRGRDRVVTISAAQL